MDCHIIIFQQYFGTASMYYQLSEIPVWKWLGTECIVKEEISIVNAALISHCEGLIHF